MRFRRVPELDDERMAFERLLDDPALHAFTAAVNQAYLSQPGFMRRVDVLLDHGGNVARRERMQVDSIFERDACVTTAVSAGHY